jgi:hypothetical protein
MKVFVKVNNKFKVALGGTCQFMLKNARFQQSNVRERF